MTDQEKKAFFELVDFVDQISTHMRNLHHANIRMIERLGLKDDYYNYFVENVIAPSKEAKQKKEKK